MLISELRKRLTDEKSRIIFDARINYSKDKRLSSFYQNIKKNGDKYTFREVDEFIQETDVSSLVIFGCSDCSQYSYRALKDSHYPVLGLVSDNCEDVLPENIPLYSLKIFCSISSKVGIIVFDNDFDSVPLYILDTYIILRLPNHVVGRTGNQYFDYFLPEKDEIFLDGGSLDGITTKKFIEWCSGNYGAVYAFEPNPTMAEECRKNLERFAEPDKLFFYQYALWDRKEERNFDNSGGKWSAHIDDKGQFLIHTECIDSLLKDKKVTFIKLDIEGSELQALSGAKECIQTNHPRMAVSVYHHADDMEKIMNYLLFLCPDYHFALRHYHSDAIETILYAY